MPPSALWPRKKARPRVTLEELEKELGLADSDQLTELERELGLSPAGIEPVVRDEDPLRHAPVVVTRPEDPRPRPTQPRPETRPAPVSATLNEPSVRERPITPVSRLISRSGFNEAIEPIAIAERLPKPTVDEFTASVARTGFGLTADIAGGVETALGGRANPRLTAIPRAIRKAGTAAVEALPPPKVPTVGDVRDVRSAIDYGLSGLGEAVTSMAPLVVAGITTGGAGAFALGGAMAAGAVRRDMEELGITDEVAIRNVTALVAPAIAVLDTRVPGQIAKRMIRQQVTGALRRMGYGQAARHTVASAARSGLAEKVTEVGQEAAQYAGVRAATGRPMSAAEFVPRAVEAGIKGGMGGAAFGGAVGAVEAAGAVERERAERRREAGLPAQAEALRIGVGAERPRVPEPPAEAREYVPTTDPRHVEPENQHIRQIAQAIKTDADPQAIEEAAAEMAARVPPGSVLVPMPGSAGASLGNQALATAIARRVQGAEVVDALARVQAVESSMKRRQAGIAGLTPEEHVPSLARKAPLGTDRSVVLIDNVTTSGNTAEAARRVLGIPNAQIVTYAKAPVPAFELAGRAAAPPPMPPQAPPEHQEAAAALTELPPKTMLEADDPRIPYRPEQARPAQSYFMLTEDIERDPSIMQYKGGVDERGVTGKFETVTAFNPALAGAIYVWRDPATGRVLAANGHHRHELAERTGYPVMEVKFIDAPDAAAARAEAAVQNIAEGQGTAIDAGRFFRETGATREELRRRGVSLSGSLASRGMALSQLSDPVFDLVNRGVVTESHGVLMGQTLTDPKSQEAAARILGSEDGRELSASQATELLEDVARTGVETVTIDDLFGGAEMAESIILERSRLIDGIRKRLRSQRALLATVGNEVKAQILEQRGVAKIDIEEAELQAQALTKLDEALTLAAHDPASATFRLLSDAARRVKGGQSVDAQIREIEPAVHAALRAVVGIPGRPSGEPGEGAYRPEGIEVGAPAPAVAAGEAPAEIEGPGLFAERARRYYDPAQAELELTAAFGSPEKAADAVDSLLENSVEFVTGSLPDGVFTTGERLKNMDAAARRLARAFVTLRGQHVPDSQALHRLLHAFRSPKYEYLHFLLLNDQNDVVSHTVETSGVIDYVMFSESIGAEATLIEEIADRAKRAGATQVVVAHNHPSGDPTPSGYDMQAFHNWTKSFDAAGLKPSFYVINHRKGIRVTPYKVPQQLPDTKVTWDMWHDRIEEIEAPVDVALQPDWTDVRPAAARLAGPQNMAPYIVNTHKSAFGVLYIDTHARAIAYSPHNASAVNTLATWLPQHMRAHGAAYANLVARDARTAGQLLLTVNRARQSGDEMLMRVTDVVTAPSKLFPGEWRSTVLSGGFAPIEPDVKAMDKRAQRLFETPPEELDDFSLARFAKQLNLPKEVVRDIYEQFRQGKGELDIGEILRRAYAREGRVTEEGGLPPYEPETLQRRLANEKSALLRQLTTARTKEERQRIFEQIKAIDVRRRGAPVMRGAISAEEMAARARAGETKEAVEAITGEKVVRPPKDERQTELVTEEDLEATNEAPARDGKFANDQGSLFNPLMAPTAEAEQLRAKLGVPYAPAPKAKALIEISRDLARSIGIPLNQGRFMGGLRRAAGVFFPWPETARVGRFDQVGVTAHEIGHYVSKKELKMPTRKGAALRGAIPLTKAQMAELVAMGHALYGKTQPAGGYGEEGIAEWFKFYVTDPAELAKQAPEFTQFMDTVVFPQVPLLKQSLDQARADFTTYTASSAAARVDAMLDVKERVRAAPTVRDIVVNWYDDLTDLRGAVQKLVKAGGKRPGARAHAYVMARLTRGDTGLGDEMNKHGVIDFNTRERITDGLIPALAAIKPERMQAFRRYLISERTLEVAERGIDTGITVKDAQEIVDLGKAEFRAAAEKFWAHSNALLKYRRDGGLLTEDEYQTILKANQRRVPLYRAFDDVVDGEPDRRGRYGAGWVRSWAGLHKMRGSARHIHDPIDGLLTDTYRTAIQVNRANAFQLLARQALGTEGGGKVIEEVARPQQVVRLPLEKVLLQLRDLGLIGSDAKILRSADGFGIELKDGTVIDAADVILQAFNFREGETGAERKDMIVPALIDGKRRWFKIQSPELYDAMKGLTREEQGMLWRVMSTFLTKPLRAGATLSLEFIARNPVRDMFTAAIRTRAGGAPPPGYHFMRGLFHMLANDEVFRSWRLEGGDHAAQLQLDRKQLRRYVDQAMRPAAAKFGDVVIHPIDTLRMLSSLFENATRVGEFEAVSRRARKRGMRPTDVGPTAALAARDISVDFNMAGLKGRAANQIMAFFNATLQGPYLMLQDFRHRPQVVVPRAIAWITLPSLLLHYLQRDDEAYQEVPRWVKDIFWVIVDRSREEPWDVGPLTRVTQDTKTGEWIRIWRIPKPFEWGILFGTLPERIAEYIDSKDPEALTSAFKALVKALSPVDLVKVDPIPVPLPLPLPTGLNTLVENAANYSFFFDRPIVPQGAERAAPEEQVKEYTGEFARLIGDAFGQSPAKFEHLIRGLYGGVGTSVLEAANVLTREGREAMGMESLIEERADLRDPTTRIPGLRGFTVQPPSATSAESVNRFYNEYNKAEGKRLAWRSKEKQGRPRAAAEYFEKNRADIESVYSQDDSPEGQRGPLREAYNTITKLKQQRKEALKTMDAQVARATVRTIDQQVIDIARDALAGISR